jgi:flavodoxin
LQSFITYVSYHQNNTEKIAKVIANTLSAEMKTADKTMPNSLSDYDLIGFGSGIYFGKHHKTLLKLVKQLPKSNKKVFLFSTAGTAIDRAEAKNHEDLRKALQ